MKFKVAIAGATGYAGAELVRLLSSHPNAEIVAVTSSRKAGSPLTEVCPWLDTNLILEPFSENLEADLIFLCQESGFASEVTPNLEKKMKVIDLSADFRLKDAATYEKAYKRPWTSNQLMTHPAYGLPEIISRKEIANANVVANPGCYPTVSLLALMPLVKAGMLGGTPIIDAKSGVSGAGRSRYETDYLFTEIAGGFKPYALSGHRHQPEIEQFVGQSVRFTPHLLPVARGIEATIYASLNTETTLSNLEAIYHTAYANEPFVRIVKVAPTIKQVVGSNRCDISLAWDEEEPNHLIITAVIDNLIKGASGQAIQNMNLLFGIEEGVGLPHHGFWP